VFVCIVFFFFFFFLRARPWEDVIEAPLSINRRVASKVESTYYVIIRSSHGSLASVRATAGVGELKFSDMESIEHIWTIRMKFPPN
jgi:hypothetical protein